MESRLNELIQALAMLEAKSYEIDNEKRDMEESIRNKEAENYNSIKDVKLKIQEAQNEIGSQIPLKQDKEDNLRTELNVIDVILSKTNHDESKVVLSYEVPSPSDAPYSIHINLSTQWDPSYYIFIKTKCSAVENIVRETLVQYKNIYHHGLASEDDKHFDLNLRREWEASRHNEKDIHFNHKKAATEE
jgi:hypothetical protein